MDQDRLFSPLLFRHGRRAVDLTRHVLSTIFNVTYLHVSGFVMAPTHVYAYRMSHMLRPDGLFCQNDWDLVDGTRKLCLQQSIRLLDGVAMSQGSIQTWTPAMTKMQRL